jgi:hypothetical protein
MLTNDKTRCNVSLGELLEQVQQYYVDRFIKTRDELLAKQKTRLIPEPELRGFAMGQSLQKEPFNSPSPRTAIRRSDREFKIPLGPSQ